MITVMRVVLDIPTKFAKAFLDYIAQASTEAEVIVKVRLVYRRNEQAPDILWEVEFLANNGGIYKMLLGGGQK